MSLNFTPKLNFQKSEKDSRDLQLLSLPPTMKGFSQSADLAPGCTNIKNQGSVGSCTAHAVVALYEYNYRRHLSDEKVKEILHDVFSERFLYYITRVNIAKWSANEDSGAFLRDVLKGLVKLGVCREEKFPYRIGSGECDYRSVPPPSAYEDALKYQALTYLNVPEGETLDERKKSLGILKELLSRGYPWVGGFICFSNMFDGQNGMIPMPDITGGMNGGHAVCFVGYDDSRKVFKFKNSWGPEWGDNGYGYLPYDYWFKGYLSDIWTVFTQEFEDKSIGVSRPLALKVSGTGVNGSGVGAVKSFESVLNDGLLSIAQGEVPVIPLEMKEKEKRHLQAFFNRVAMLRDSTLKQFK
jgi:C1A family cysteine protease